MGQDIHINKSANPRRDNIYLDDAISEHGLLMEPSSFLLKPFNRRVLLEKVREVLDAE